ncbi:MAG: sugar kinase [Burkholderiaceae bacterium]
MPGLPLDVVTVGEAMALFAADRPGPLEAVDHYTRGSAGAELNVAIGLARLGLRIGYISRLGDDSFGRQLIHVLDGEGIDRSQVEIDPAHPTGFMLKSRSDDGSDPRTEYFRRGSAASHLAPGPARRDYAAGARHLHLTGICLALSESARELVHALAQDARGAGRCVSVDPNLRPSLWRSQAEMIDGVNRLAVLADWMLPGLAEGRLLTGRDDPPGIAAWYLDRGVTGVVVKLGAGGAWCATAAGGVAVAGVPAARVVDTVGAGDGYAVGFISGLLEGLPPARAAARGNAIGARVVGFPGDCDGLPTRAQLDALMPAAPDPSSRR